MFWVNTLVRNNPKPVRRTTWWTELHLKNSQSNQSSTPAGLPNTPGIISTPVWPCCDFWGGNRPSGQVSHSMWSSLRPHFKIKLYEAIYETRTSVWMQLAMKGQASSEGCGNHYGYLLTHRHLGYFFSKAVQFSKTPLVRQHLNKSVCKQISFQLSRWLFSDPNPDVEVHPSVPTYNKTSRMSC